VLAQRRRPPLAAACSRSDDLPQLDRAGGGLLCSLNGAAPLPVVVAEREREYVVEIESRRERIRWH
jgi:hypothetical protein